MDKTTSMIGRTIFILGLLISAIIAVFNSEPVPGWAIYTIAAIGLIVGIINVTAREVLHFLVASAVFILSFQALSNIFTVLALGWEAVGVFFNLMSVFVSSAGSIVALRALFVLARD